MTTDHFTQNMLPRFTDIEPSKIQALIREQLSANRQKLADLIAQPQPYTWENLLQPLEEMNDAFGKLWSPIGHVHAVMETEALRKAYNDTLPLIVEYQTEVSQNTDLFNAIQSVKDSQGFEHLNAAQQKIIMNDIRDFNLSGVNLSPELKIRMGELQQQLSQVMTKFSENILDATQAFIWHTTDVSLLAGLPDQALQLARDNAKARNLEGYVLTLDYPSYSTALKFLHARDIRQTLYEAYTTRASDRGPQAGKWDNAPLLEKILTIRREMAELVGFSNYADYSLATKMAKSPDDVLNFLYDLLQRSKSMAKEELAELADLAQKTDQLPTIASWDTAYYSEKLRISKFNFSQEDLRPYFPIDKVLPGMFSVIKKLYGLTIQKQSNIEVWHPEAAFFTVVDEHQQLRGGFYIDLYARPHKRDGAWMDECVGRSHMTPMNMQYPVAFLTCNFMQPVEGKPALLNHDDVNTLFHEFGHCLHHLLTTVNYPSVAGINGVPWDAVEFPSQFLENYCWEKESLDLFAGHYETGAPLPDDLYEKMMDAKHFQTGMQMVRQIEFSLFDFRLHLEHDPTIPEQTDTILKEIRKETTIVPVPEFNRFPNSFSHIFAGGYGAGYYSYKWAEVLSADAYAQFEENGIFDKATGKSFMENILEVGGVRDPMVSFTAFRGREPRIDALLRQSGIQD